MYQAKGYWERLNLTNVCNYLRSGEDQAEKHTGTPAERVQQYNKDLVDGISLFLNRVIEYDWSKVSDDESERMRIAEDMYQEIYLAVADLGFLDYEMGFFAAATIIFGKEIDPRILNQKK